MKVKGILVILSIANEGSSVDIKNIVVDKRQMFKSGFRRLDVVGSFL